MRAIDRVRKLESTERNSYFDGLGHFMGFVDNKRNVE